MTLSKRLYWLAGLVAIFAIAAAAITMVSTNGSAQSSPPAAVDDQADGETDDDVDGVADTNDDHADGEMNDGDDEADGDNNEVDDGDGETDDENGDPANAGKLDDGADLLPQASITIDEAIAAAQTAGNGDIGEIDLEYHDGKLVFNVDVGDQDVKVDAATGTVLGSGED
jgi:uncharacterized membrane protein YkoI